MTKLRILTWEDYPGFSGWAPNAITNALRREHSVRSQRRGEDDVTTKAETKVTRVKECQLLSEAERGEEHLNSPPILQSPNSPTDTLMFTH